MSKSEFRQRLNTMFGVAHVEGYLARFRDNHVFAEKNVGTFIAYINALPAIGTLPEERGYSD